MSKSFSKDFDINIGELECRLRVLNDNGHKVSASSVFCDCTLDIFRVSYPIYLIPILMGDVCMILDMEWLS